MHSTSTNIKNDLKTEIQVIVQSNEIFETYVKQQKDMKNENKALSDTYVNEYNLNDNFQSGNHTAITRNESIKSVTNTINKTNQNTKTHKIGAAASILGGLGAKADISNTNINQNTKVNSLQRNKVNANTEENVCQNESATHDKNITQHTHSNKSYNENNTQENIFREVRKENYRIGVGYTNIQPNQIMPMSITIKNDEKVYLTVFVPSLNYHLCQNYEILKIVKANKMVVINKNEINNNPQCTFITDYTCLTPHTDEKMMNESDLKPFQKLLYEWNLQQFISQFVEYGWDDIDTWDQLNAEELAKLGFKTGHIAKFLKCQKRLKPAPVKRDNGPHVEYRNIYFKQFLKLLKNQKCKWMVEPKKPQVQIVDNIKIYDAKYLDNTKYGVQCGRIVSYVTKNSLSECNDTIINFFKRQRNFPSQLSQFYNCAREPQSIYQFNAHEKITQFQVSSNFYGISERDYIVFEGGYIVSKDDNKMQNHFDIIDEKGDVQLNEMQKHQIKFVYILRSIDTSNAHYETPYPKAERGTFYRSGFVLQSTMYKNAPCVKINAMFEYDGGGNNIIKWAAMKMIHPLQSCKRMMVKIVKHC
eukprot:486033_1